VRGVNIICQLPAILSAKSFLFLFFFCDEVSFARLLKGQVPLSYAVLFG
jgi:hypothetical protein